MIHEYPKYFEQFECVGGSCKDSCCIGWELDIDEETCEYYKNLQGEFGDRLRASMREGEDNTFVLGKDDRCPFLNEDNLCDIIINIGEESLCKICTEYPRYNELVEGYMQSDLNLSCMEAGKIIFGDNEPVRYVKMEEVNYNCSEDGISGSLKALLKARDTLIGIVNSAYRGNYTLNQAIHIVSKAVGIVHEYYADGEYDSIERFSKKLALFKYNNRQIKTLLNKSNENDSFFKMVCENWSRIYELLGELEVIDDAWEKVLDDTDCHMTELGRISHSEEGKKLIDDFEGCMHDFEKTDMKIILYFIFRYMIRAYDDGNITAKVKFAIFSYSVIKAMDYARWQNNGYVYTLEDRIDIAHIYSKEVEHSAENVDYLLEEMLFS